MRLNLGALGIFLKLPSRFSGRMGLVVLEQGVSMRVTLRTATGICRIPGMITQDLVAASTH